MIDKILKKRRSKDSLVLDEIPITDEQWISHSFLIREENLDKRNKSLRFASLADYKFVDTSLGGNISINCFPQFTRYCDIRSKGILKGRNDVKINDLNGNIGMGEYYATTIDDNSTNVYFEFGVPEFNNVLFFLLSAVDYRQAVIANSGRSPLFYYAGYFLGLGAVFLAFPVITIGVLVAKAILSFAPTLFSNHGRFDHYYLKPTMFVYWSTVNSIVTMMATELGILSPIFENEKGSGDKIGIPLKVDQEQLDAMRKIVPGLITSGNAINIHAIVAKTQILYNKYIESKTKVLKKVSNQILSTHSVMDLDATITQVDPIDPNELSGDNDLWHRLQKHLTSNKSYNNSKEKPKDLSEVIDELKISYNDKNSNGEEVKKTALTGINADGTVPRKLRDEDSKTWLSKAYETAKAVYDEGARFAVFRVNHIESTTESFSNATTTVGLGDKVNGLGKAWREIKFTAGSVIPGALESVANAVTDTIMGTISGLTLGLSDSVVGFLKGANIEVPKRWESSSASFPSLSFKMQLISPSAHPIAQLRNIYIPLAAILAATLPLATGPRSHTSPFLCSMFVRGRQKINLGMITELSITRGTSNLPFNRQRRPLAVDVNFTVTDFYDVISAPVSKDILSPGNTMLDDDAGINRYIQALCARDLYASTHIFNKAKISISRALQDVSVAMSPEAVGAWAGDLLYNVPFASLFTGEKKVDYSESF